MVAESGVALAVPWLGGRVAEGMLSHRMLNTGSVLLALLALFAVQALLKFGNGYLLSRSEEHIVADLRIRIYDHLQALPLGFYHQRRQGEILALLTHDVENLSDFISGTLLSVIPLLVTVAGALLFMFHIDPMLSLIAAVLVPVFYLILKVIGRRLRPLASLLQEAHAGAVAIAEENLGMLPAIKTFTREPQESARYRSQIDHILTLSTPATRHLCRTGTRHAATGRRRHRAGPLAGRGTGERRHHGTRRTGDVPALHRAADPPGQCPGRCLRPDPNRAGCAGAVDAGTHRTARTLSHIGHELRAVRGEIEFRAVNFAYPGRPPALADVNLHIRAGETVAIIGPNGAGKSTLAHLLMRIHEPLSGCIYIDGTDIAGVTLHSLRRQIGVVPQHVLLFNGSARDNIAYGHPDPTPASHRGGSPGGTRP